MNRLTLVLLILGIGLALLLINNSSGQTFGIDNDRFASAPSTSFLIAEIASRRCSLSRTWNADAS